MGAGVESRKTVLIYPDVETGVLPGQVAHKDTCYTLKEAAPFTLEELVLKLNNGKRRQIQSEVWCTHL